MRPHCAPLTHITVGPEHRSAYGGVRSIELFDDRLEVKVAQSAAELLGTDLEVVVRFEISLESLAQLAEAFGLMAGSVFADRRGR